MTGVDIKCLILHEYCVNLEWVILIAWSADSTWYTSSLPKVLFIRLRSRNSLYGCNCIFFLMFGSILSIQNPLIGKGFKLISIMCLYFKENNSE